MCGFSLRFPSLDFFAFTPAESFSSFLGVVSCGGRAPSSAELLVKLECDSLRLATGSAPGDGEDVWEDDCDRAGSSGYVDEGGG